jgi:hypothetical protein
VETPAAPAVVEAPVAAPAEAAPAPIATQPVQVSEVPVQPAQAPAQPEQVQQATAPAVAGTQLLENVRQEIDKSRDVYVQALSQHYQMTEEEASAVLTEPEKVLPALAARVHLEVVQAVLGTMAQTMPGVITGVLAAQKQNTELVDKFFTQWPQLDRNKDYQTVVELAGMYRRMKPNAGFDEISRDVGATAMVRLGRLPTAPAQAQVAQAPIPAYRPASGVAPTQLQPPQQDGNPWAAIAEIFDE